MLALAVAITGILATMPYIALQLVGIQAIIDTIGIGGNGNAFVRDLPLLIAFAVLAAYTYSSGLRAPAMIAFVKDSLIYLVIAVAIIYVGVHIGFHHLFESAQTKMATKNPKTHAATGVFVPAKNNYWAYATLALGSAMALFMYPHSMTAVLSGRSRNVIRRNASILPTYSLMLGLLALLGYAAIAEKTSVIGTDGKPNPQLAVPHFFRDQFPHWFAGVAYAAIAIGALVPAAIMSIAAANLFTRNIYREFIVPRATPQARGHGLQDHLAGGEVRRADLRAVAGQAERDQPAIARRRLDPADVRVHRGRALHPLAAPVGAAGRLGGRHALRHGRRLSPVLGRDQALRRLAGDLPVHPHQGLHRVLGAGAQHGGVGGAHPGAAGGADAGRRGPHRGRGLLRRARPRSPAGCPVPRAACRPRRRPAGPDADRTREIKTALAAPIGCEGGLDEAGLAYSARYSRWLVSMATWLSRPRIRSFSSPGAMSPPQLRATNDFTSCSRPYRRRHGAQSSRCSRIRCRASSSDLVVQIEVDVGQHLAAVQATRAETGHEFSPSVLPDHGCR